MEIKDLFRNIEYPIRLYDKNNNEIYYEDSDGYWEKSEYNENNNEIYYEDSDGDWEKREYDKNSNLIYYEDSSGYIVDNRPKETKELTAKEISDLLGYEVKIIK